MPGLSIRANGSSLPLVLIERIAHVRGPVPGVSIRALGSELPLVLIKRIAHVRGGDGLALSAPCGGTLACRLGQALNGAHWAPAPPKGGGETWLSLRESWHGGSRD